jgi:general secretion pathway protein G
VGAVIKGNEHQRSGCHALSKSDFKRYIIEAMKEIAFAGVHMNRQAGLPRIKILLLVLLCSTSVFILVFSRDLYNISVNHARESVLKRELQSMRMAIDKYTVDNQHPPQSLQNLVDQRYLRMIPTNPITKKVDWVPHYVNLDLGDGKSAVCINDVRASPGQTDSSGVPYSDW